MNSKMFASVSLPGSEYFTGEIERTEVECKVKITVDIFTYAGKVI